MGYLPKQKMQYVSLLCCFILLSTSVLSVVAFNVCHISIHFGCHGSHGSKLVLSLADNGNGQELVPPSSSDEDKTLNEELQKRHEEIQIDKTRSALEEQHTQSFMKKRPVKLPYKHAQKWVQANLGVNTKEEFEDFVAMGYIGTPYIPKNPEQYYMRTREWISWDHFLNNEAAIEPRRGFFD